MNEPDFQAFAAIWQQDPPEEEVRIFRKMARRASRQARLLRYAESLFGAMIAIGAGLAFLVAPGPATGAFALLLALATIWTAWQRHRFDAAAAQVSRTAREALLESSEASARAALRKSTIGVVSALPGGVLAIALADLILRGHGDAARWIDSVPERILSPSILVSLLIMTMVTLGAWRHNRRLRRELVRIQALRSAYREEDLLDGLSSPRSAR